MIKKDDDIKNILLEYNLEKIKEKHKSKKDYSNLFNLLDNAPEPDKRFDFNIINIRLRQVFPVLLLILLGFGFLYCFNEITGLSVYNEDITLEVNNYVGNSSYVVLEINENRYEKGVNELKLELANDTYYVGSLSINLKDFGIKLDDGIYSLVITLYDNENVYTAEKEITVGKIEEEKRVSEETVNENITEENITDILNETEIINESTEINVNDESIEEINEVNAGEDIKILIEIKNVTEEENVTAILENVNDINETEIIIQNASEEENVTIEQNITSKRGGVNFTEVLIQDKAEINKKVKWIKWISLEYETDNFTLDLKNFDNLSIKEKEKDIKFDRKENNISIKEKIKDIKLEYYTKEPLIYEEYVSEYIKRIVVYSDIHYKDVLAYTNVNEYKKENIRLYWIVNDSRLLVNDIVYTDSNNNSLIDRIYWNVPYLSNQTYEISISILNIQSYPSLYGNWTVMFNTTGQADLTITASNGTTWSNVNEDNDLRFLEVKCGDSLLEYEWTDDSVFIPNYSCSNTGTETSKVLTAEKHTLMFKFGEQTAYAYNDVNVSSCQTLSTSNTIYLLNTSIDNLTGNCFTISASNVTLNCQGYTIDGNNATTGYGVIINGANYDGLTIKDCVIKEFSRNLYVGAGSDNIRIENSSLIAGYYDGMLTYSTENMYIVNSNFSGQSEYGAYVWFSGTDYNNNNWTIINSSFTGGSANSNYGFRGIYIYNSTLEYNAFKGGTGASNGFAFYGDNGTTGSIFRNNTFEGRSTTNYDRALYLRYCNNIIVDNNAFLSHKTGYAAVDAAYCDNSIWRNNNFTHESNNYGFYLQYSRNATIIDSIMSSASSVGLGLYGVNSSLITNITAINIGASYGLYMANYNYNNTLRNNNFSGMYAMYQAYSDYNLFENNNFTSTTGYTYIRYSNDNNYTSNNFTATANYGAWFYTQNNRNTLTNNKFLSLTSFGARIYDNSDSNKFYNNNFSGVSYGLYFDTGNDNNIFENNYFGTSGGGSALAVLTRCNNNTFNNCSFISGKIADSDAVYIATSANKNRFFNSTIIGDRFGVYINNADNNIFEDNFINATNSAGTNADADGIYIYFTPKSSIIRRNNVSAYRFPVYLLYGVQYSNITDNIFMSQTADFRVYDSCDYNVIENNSITSGAMDGSIGMYIYSSNNNQIRNNSIRSGDYGIYLQSSSSNIIDNNNISVVNRTIAGSYGVYLYMFSNNNNLTGNSILSKSDDNIRIYASLNNLIRNNTISYSDDYGIYMQEGSEENQIEDNLIYNNTDDGIYLISSYSNSILSNNISLNANGITTVDSLWNKIKGNKIIGSRSVGLNLGDATTGSSIFANDELNDNFINNSGTNDIVLVSSTINAINMSFNKTRISVDSSSSATFNWWVDVNVGDTIAQVPNVTVKVYDNTGVLIDTKITDANGYITKFNLSEYYQTSTGKTYYSNYTFNASTTNYFDSSVSYNITTNTIINITLIESLPPILRSISLSPSSDDNIDPNVQINATANVTDYIAVNTAILQYKENNNTEWINNSMIYDSNTRLFTNGLFTPNNNDTWNYRIWANDTYGNSNFSEYYNVSVQYDSSWNRTPSDLGTVIGVLSTIGTIGNLTINNTGDFNLTIDLSSTWSDIVYNITEPFVIKPKEIIIFGINITFDESITDINSKIIIDASGEQTPNPLQLNTTVLISSYTGGPYLDLTLPTYPSVATQTSIQTIKAKIQNLAKYATETIYNITLNWSLPIGWSILSGDITVNFTNLTAQSIGYANLSVMISTSAPYDINGSNTSISVSAVSDSNTNDALSVNVSLLCGADGVCGQGCWDDVDSDCVGVSAPSPSGGSTATSGSSGGGGGGGSSGVSVSRALKLKESSQTVEILKGESSQFSLDIENIYPNSVLKDVTLDVKGFLKQYIKVEPSKIQEIGYKNKDRFTVNIDVPSYLSFGTYQLETTITGNLIKDGISQTLTERRFVTLIVQEITKDAALDAISLGEEIIEGMKKEGFPVTLISRMLDDAKIAYENKQYKNVKDLVDEIAEKKVSAYEARTLMEDIKKRISDAEKQGLDVSTTQKLLNMAIAAFEREDYTTAIQNLKEAQLTELLETKGRVNIIKFIINYWWIILISIVCLIIIGAILYRRVYLFIISYKILYLSKEERNILSLIKDTQNKYYIKKEIDYTKYTNTIDQYNKRLTEIRQKRLRFTSKKSVLLSSIKALESLREERKSIIKTIGSCQKKYFVTKTISLARYNTEINLNQIRLAEIDKNIEILNVKLEKERNLIIHKIKNKILFILSKLSEFKLKEVGKTVKKLDEVEERVIKEDVKKRIVNEVENKIKKRAKKGDKDDKKRE